MSEQVKTQAQEGTKMDPKYLGSLALTLLVTCVIVAGLLGLVNSVTAGPIAQINLEKTQAAMKEVVPNPASTFSDALELSDAAVAAAAGYKTTLLELYQVQSNGAPAGYTVKVSAPGSQGKIEMMVGVDLDYAVTGVSIVSHSETSGIGSKVTDNENGVLDQFAGMSHAGGDLAVGSNVDAITGATVSSKGVTSGVNAALAAVEAMG